MTTNSSVTKSWHWFINAISFVSVAIIGVVLLFVQIFDAEGGVFYRIANALAYVVIIACSFVFASGKLRRKKGWIYMLIWAIGTVLIVIAYIIPLARSL